MSFHIQAPAIYKQSSVTPSQEPLTWAVVGADIYGLQIAAYYNSKFLRWGIYSTGNNTRLYVASHYATNGGYYNYTGTHVATGQRAGYDGTNYAAPISDGTNARHRYSLASNPSTSFNYTISSGTGGIYSMYYGNSTWVAVGAYNTSTNACSLWYSSSLTSGWTLATVPVSSVNLHNLMYDNGLWVVVGASNTILTATSPSGTWTQRTSPFAVGTNIYGVDYGSDSKWVISGTNNKLGYASDPTSTWTENTSHSMTGTIRCVESGSSNVWVACTSAGQIATANGAAGTWTNRATGYGSLIGISTNGTQWNVQKYGTGSTTGRVYKAQNGS